MLLVVSISRMTASAGKEASQEPTVDDFSESFTEVVGQESVENGIDARIGVGQYVWSDLDHDCQVIDFEKRQALEDENELNGAPTNGKDDDDNADHASDALLATTALRWADASTGRRSTP